MHDIRFIRDHPDAFDRALVRRGIEPQVRRLIALDETRREKILALETAQARRNEASKLIGAAKKSNEEETAQALMAEVAALKESIPKLEAEEKAASKALNDALAEIPNLPADDVPDGKDASANVERHRFGAKRDYAFTPKQHFELGEALGQMDFETAAKLSGARFVVLKKGLARLERALGQFMLDVHTGEHGYTEVAPPLMVSSDAMMGTGQLPKFENDQFLATNMALANKDTTDLLDIFTSEERPREPADQADFIRRINKLIRTMERLNYDPKTIEGTVTRALRKFELGQLRFEPAETSHSFERLWLIPTAEVPLTNLVRESIVDEAQLPTRLTACTPCFRAEAGAAGKDTRGMIRQHQFAKVELVSITTPEQSKDEHERMLSCAEEVLKRLDLHYRVMTLCAGDMGFAAQKTHDIEVWLPGQNTYREISSCSNCGEFQSRRMKARYRPGRLISGGALIGAMMPGTAMLNQPPAQSSPRHVHTLNGSGVAVGRALIAVMETYQQDDCSILVPEALVPYMGGIKKIEK
jgi:seryl-tRNA synthetase